MIWANNTKGVCSHLFLGYGKANSDPLAKENLHHLIFISALFLVWTVGHMDPYTLRYLINWGGGGGAGGGGRDDY